MVQATGSGTWTGNHVNMLEAVTTGILR